MIYHFTVAQKQCCRSRPHFYKYKKWQNYSVTIFVSKKLLDLYEGISCTGGLSYALFISLLISKLFCTKGYMGGGGGAGSGT